MKSEQQNNHFATPEAATHYKQGRPDFHMVSIEHYKAFAVWRAPVQRALDVGCGTGLSTKALLDVADHIEATDSSAEMLQLAYAHPRITYSQASAEHQPFPDNSFDLITVCSGVHWFDIDSFLLECHRLLKPDGWLVLYDNYFLGECRENEQLKQWYVGTYLKRFPPPPRNDRYDWSEKTLGAKQLRLAGEETFVNEVELSKQALVKYLITQSNIINAVTLGIATYKVVREWLDSESEACFPLGSDVVTFRFGNWIKYIKLLDSTANRLRV